jgi:WD40 repeat protein
MLLTGPHADRDELRRFEREAEALTRLTHPNIVQVYEVGTCDSQPYIAMEFVAGGTLAQELKGTPVRPKRAAELVETLARAMHAAHGQGIVHRDLKPANILLTGIRGQESGGSEEEPPSLTPVPKIADFGLAKLLDHGTQLTRSGAILGTPSYMAPEQAQEGKEIGPAADIYALGAILYELLTGRPPFKAATALETIQQVCSAEPVPPSLLLSTVPHDLDTICLTALAKEPSRRYATAEEMADDLGRFRKGEPIRARPVSRAKDAGSRVGRNSVVTAAAALAAVLLAGIGISTFLAIQRTRERERTSALIAGAEVAQRQAEAKLREAQVRATEMGLDRALAEKEPSRTMLWLARLLDLAPADADELRRAIRINLAASRPPVRLKNVLHRPSNLVKGGLALPAAGRAPLVAGRTGTQVQLLNADTGDCVGAPFSAGGGLQSVALSPDSNTILTASDTGEVQQWDLTTGKPRGVSFKTGGNLTSMAVAPDGQAVLTGSADKTARLWDLPSGKLRFALQHRGLIWSVAISPDGKLLLTGSDDRTARLWDAATGKPSGEPIPHPAGVLAVAFRPDSKQFLTGTQEGKAQLWSTATGKPHGPAMEHADQVRSVTFSPDGKMVLTGGEDHTARLWDAETGQPLGEPLQHDTGPAVQDVAFGPDGKQILTNTGLDVRLWEAAPGPVVLANDHPVTAVAFSPDGKTILTGTANLSLLAALLPFAVNRGEVRLWDAATGRQRLGPIPQKDMVLSAVFSPDGNRFLTGTGHPLAGAGEARLWDTATGKPVGPPLDHPEGVLAVAFNPDGQSFLTGSRDRTARVWSAATGKPLRTFRHPAWVVAAAYSPDGQRLLTGCPDGTARLWNLATDEPTAKEFRHGRTVAGTTFSPDGRTILTAGDDRTARQWDVGTGKPIGKVFQHRSWIRPVAYSPDGRLVLTGSGDKTARVWDVATGKPIGPPLVHGDWVLAAAFSPDGRKIVTGSKDGTARLWEAPVPVEGEPERLVLWVQVLTGMQMDADEAVHVLDGPSWLEQRRQLQALGGAPLP